MRQNDLQKMMAKEREGFLEVSWSAAWSSALFRKKFITASVLFTAVLLYFPYFFKTIQQRQGRVLNDCVLNILPAVDVSVFIFTTLYLLVAYGIFKAVQSPETFLLFLWTCLFLSIARMLTITLFPLDPPIKIVELVDPVLLPFYGHSEINRDLFFSGHTSSAFVIFLILK
ncbi:MAG TPA: hypothetical protein VF623_00680, partial [Segetibacter sp.]